MATAKQGGKSKSSSEAQKARRSKSWANGQKRKQARVEAQRKRAEKNRELRAKGLPVPWEKARQERAQRRAAAVRQTVGGKS